MLLAPYWAQAQIDSTINLDLLRAPSSPAANLVGISANEVQKPTSIKDFAVTLQNASNNYSSLPTNFAVDIAPFKIGKYERLKDVLSDKMTPLQILKNSLVLSLATKTGGDKDTNADSTQVGFGLKFSLFQGDLSAETNKSVNEVYALLKKSVAYSDTLNSLVRAVLVSNTEFKKRRSEQITIRSSPEGSTPEGKQRLTDLAIEIDSLRKIIQTASETNANYKLHKEYADSLTAAAYKKLQNLKIQRYGFSLDVASGLALNFQNNRFNSGKMYRYATWVTLGWLYKSGFSLLGIARHQFNPDKVFADDKNTLKTTTLNTLDTGIRIDYSGNERSKFSINSEYIYRSVLNNSLVEPSWRGTINASYEIRKNYLLTFSFGRDFDKKISTDGNVIAAINLIAGFGNPQVVK